MSNEQDKGLLELMLFASFASRCGIAIVPGSAEKREPPEPDILCKHESGEALAFELAESTRDNSKKLSKACPVVCNVELLLYTNGRTALSDDTIQAKLESILQDGIVRYKRIWFFGDDLHVLAQGGWHVIGAGR